ncbi:MAG: hypothetical protein IJA08_00430 [Clostridia bacterium]|nr:hypothetical protein [Clostridia bacterium]
MIHTLKMSNYEINVRTDSDGAVIESGNFGEVRLLSEPIFRMRIKNIATGESKHISSESGWGKVRATKRASVTEFCFLTPEKMNDIGVFVEARKLSDGVKWSIEVINNNSDFSVMELTYPTPKMTGEKLDYFIPYWCGRVFDDATNKDFYQDGIYPHWGFCMQYFAIYGKKNGIYIGIEDGEAASKRFECASKDGVCTLNAEFYGIGASLSANSFQASGKCHWRFLDGDWYDASLIYADFVRHEAKWLPEIDENGRPDTPDRFKHVPFWICDYIPNSESQRDNKPASLSAGSDIYEKSYWYQAPIELQKQLGVPIAYHVYNWHEIPFNIEYPHFLPAKKEFTDHIKELQENNVYVLPYTNALAWEINDKDAGHEINFENTGCKNVQIQEDDTFVLQEYPQTTVSGKSCQLAMACGASSEWRKMMRTLSRDVERTLGVDGIYYDQVAAVEGYPCFSKEHAHLPGGGNYWVEGHNRMMKMINAEKPEENFNFSECNSEAFMKSFDGFLTWMWVGAGEVPAYPTVYAGYIQMLGRNTNGAKKDDFEFFKYCGAKSFLYGQQIGWSKADIVYSEKHMEFLKKIVNERYKYTEVFNGFSMLRPPKVTTNLEKLTTGAGLWFDGEIVCDYVLAGGWRQRNGQKTYIFAINYAEDEAEYTLSVNCAEYGISETNLPEGFTICGDLCTIEGSLNKYEVKVWEYDHV